MKKLFLLLATVAMFATACTEGGEEIDGQQPTGGPISVSQGRVNVDFVGGECELTVNAKCSWAATCSANWITIQTPEGIAGKEPLRFNVARNTESSERKTTITLKNDNYNLIQEIYVIQSAFTPGTKSDYVIYYTSSDGNIIEPDIQLEGFGANIISNKYEDGQGTLLFDAPVTLIGYNTFYGCTSLTNIIIPDSVTEIGVQAFWGCTSLTSVTIPDSVTSIGSYAFTNCTSLTSVTIPNSVTSIGDYAFYYCSSLTSVTIPDSVTSIGYSEFYGCTSLTSVTIGNSVTKIEFDAFYGCTSLTSVTIPNSVISIGENAFRGCVSLTSFYGKFSSKDKCCLIVDSTLVAFAPACGKTSYIIPDSVTSIGYAAFAYCSSLTGVTIGNSVTSIGYRAFWECRRLTSVTIPNSVTKIGSGVFGLCTSLTSVTIPDSVTSIEGGAFEYCTSLTSIVIPDSVTEIGREAFYNCSSLKEVYCKPTTPPTGSSNMFNGNDPGRKIYVSRASVEAYKSASYWKDYSSDIEGYDF